MTLPVFTGVWSGESKVTVTIPAGFSGKCMVAWPNAAGGTTRVRDDIPPPLPKPSCDHVFVDSLGGITVRQPR